MIHHAKYTHISVDEIQKRYGWTIGNIHQFAHDDGWSVARYASSNWIPLFREDHVQRTAARIGAPRFEQDPE